LNTSSKFRVVVFRDFSEHDKRWKIRQQKGRALSEVGNLASALRQTGENLGDGGIAGNLINRAADTLENFNRSLDGKDLDTVLRDVETFARRNPAAFLGAAAAIGFAAARFVKSSGRAVAAEPSAGAAV